MELILSGSLDEVLVAADPGGLHGLGGQLLQLVGHLRTTCQNKNLEIFRIYKYTGY